MKTKQLNYPVHGTMMGIIAGMLMTYSCSSETVVHEEKTIIPVLQSEAAQNQSGIHDAVLRNDVNWIKKHLASGGDINEIEPFGGSTPLISAAFFGKTEVAKLLIESGAALNLQNNDGSTALHVASFFCRTDIVALLLKKGADKHVRNKYDKTAYESVSVAFADVKGVYDIMQKMFGPMGLKLDYAYLEKTRPQIAAMLK